jgi:hypothetical protein
MPTDYTALLEHIEEHGNLRKACRDLGVGKTAFFEALNADPALAEQYARAKERGIDNMMEACLDAEIEDPAKSRLDWDRKRWHASKLFAKKYGDKQLIGSDPENPLPEGFKVTFGSAKGS